MHAIKKKDYAESTVFIGNTHYLHYFINMEIYFETLFTLFRYFVRRSSFR